MKIKRIILLISLVYTWGIIHAQFFNAATDIAQLAELIALTNAHIKKTEAIYKSTTSMIQILNDPKKSIKELTGLKDAINQFDLIIGNESSHQVLKLSESVEDISKTFDRLQHSGQSTMHIGGVARDRDYKLYEVYYKMNDLYKRYDGILNSDNALQKKEIDRQKNLYVSLNKSEGLSPDQRSQILLGIEASKGLQEASTNRVMTASTRIDQEYKAKRIQDELEAELQHEERIENEHEMIRRNKEYAKEEKANLEKLLLTTEQHNKYLNIK